MSRAEEWERAGHRAPDQSDSLLFHGIKASHSKPTRLTSVSHVDDCETCKFVSLLILLYLSLRWARRVLLTEPTWTPRSTVLRVLRCHRRVNMPSEKLRNGNERLLGDLVSRWKHSNAWPLFQSQTHPTPPPRDSTEHSINWSREGLTNKTGALPSAVRIRCMASLYQILI